MIGIIAWFGASKIGRAILPYLLLAIGVLMFLWRVYAAGQNQVIAANKERQLDQLREKLRADQDFAKLSPDERRSRLERWVRDE